MGGVRIGSSHTAFSVATQIHHCGSQITAGVLHQVCSAMNARKGFLNKVFSRFRASGEGVGQPDHPWILDPVELYEVL
jgi:hypothetical protein